VYIGFFFLLLDLCWRLGSLAVCRTLDDGYREAFGACISDNAIRKWSSKQDSVVGEFQVGIFQESV
jgi:hypothetical protein